MDLRKYTEKLWKVYVLGPKEGEIQAFLDMIKENVAVIGTGRQEFYENLERFMEAYELEVEERKQIQFQIAGFTCQERRIGKEARVVYGRLHIKGEGREKGISIDMDTRYSIVYGREDGQWKIVHIHQSLPYREQKENEFYPKTLMEQVEEAQKRADEMEILAKVDQLTGILNQQSFYEEREALWERCRTAYCVAIDLDDFKKINDSYGHLEGDAVLREMGVILQEIVTGQDVVGRIGGDEFGLFCGGFDPKEEMENLADQIMGQVCERKQIWPGTFPDITIGIARTNSREDLKQAFRRADDLLYQVKESGKNGYKLGE